MEKIKKNFLYVGELSEISTSRHRYEVLKKYVSQTYSIPTEKVKKSKINEKILNLIFKKKIDFIWFDKAIYIEKLTIKVVKLLNIKTIHYNPDNCFGDRKEKIWKPFLNSITYFDYHLVPREINLKNYKDAGCKNVFLFPFTYEKKIHYINKKKIKKKIDVCFIGTLRKERIELFKQLEDVYNLKVNLYGNLSSRFQKTKGLLYNLPIYNHDYRKIIWKSKILIVLTADDNLDDDARRLYEIQACGGFIISKHKPKIFNIFGKSIAYFKNTEDLANQIIYYLKNNKKKEQMLKKSMSIIKKIKYSNDDRISNILNNIIKNEN